MSDSAIKMLLNSPCGNGPSVNYNHAHPRDNMMAILTVIEKQSSVAAGIALRDIEKFISYLHQEHLQNNTKQQLYHTERTRDVALFDERWQEMHHPWLYPSGMELGKKFNNTISEEHQSKLKDEAKNLDWAQSDHMIIKELEKSDIRFQLLSVGFHNILENHNSKSNMDMDMDMTKFDDLKDIYNRSRNYAQLMLCEIRSALYHLGKRVHIVDPEMVPKSSPHFYEWIMMREYANQLQHIRQVAQIVKEII